LLWTCCGFAVQLVMTDTFWNISTKNFLLFENYGQKVGGPIHCWSPNLKVGGPVSPGPHGCCAYDWITATYAAWPLSSVWHGRPRLVTTTTGDVIRHRRLCTEVVCVVHQRPHSVRPSWHVPFGHHSRLVWSTTRIGPWTDTFPAAHGEPTATDWTPQSASTLVRWWHANLQLLLSHSSRST